MQIYNRYDSTNNNLPFKALITKRIPEPLNTYIRKNGSELFSKITAEHDVFITATPLRTLADPLQRRTPETNEKCYISWGFKNLFGIKGLGTRRNVNYECFYDDLEDYHTIYRSNKVDLGRGVCSITGRVLDERLNSTIWENIHRINNGIRNNRERLTQVYLSPNGSGNIFIHTRNPHEIATKNFYTVTLGKKVPERVVKKYDSMYKSINSALKNYPDLLAQMYLTPDFLGRLFVEHATPARCIMMINALKDQPETLVRIYTHKSGKNAKMPIERISSEEEYTTLIQTLRDKSEKYVDMLFQNR